MRKVALIIALAILLPPSICIGALYVDGRRVESTRTSQDALDAILRAVPSDATEAQTLAVLRAHGISDRHIRIYINAAGLWGCTLPSGADGPCGNTIYAEIPQPQGYFLRINSPRAMEFTFKFAGDGRLYGASVQRSLVLLAERDKSFPPGGNIIAATPPPAP